MQPAESTYILLAEELEKCIEDRDIDRLLYFTVRYKNAEKFKMANDYFTLTNQSLVSRICAITSKDAGTMISLSWRHYLEVKADFIHESFRSKAPRRGVELSLMSSPEEWLELRKAYASAYKSDMEQMIRNACSHNTFTDRILLAWIAYRRAPRGSITEDIANLYAAASGETVSGADGASQDLQKSQGSPAPGKKPKKPAKGSKPGGPDWDFILKLIGTSVPQEWSRICSGFERRYSTTLSAMLRPHMTQIDYHAFQVASNVLCDIVQGIACLLNIYINERDVAGVIALVAMYCDKCNNLRLEYQRFGNLREDLAKVLHSDALYTCLRLLQIPE